MGRKKQMELDAPWLDLKGKIASEVLHAPKTGGEWVCVPDRVVGYFLRNVVGTPWADHLALIAAVLSAHQRDEQTVRITIVALHARFTDLFAALVRNPDKKDWNSGGGRGGLRPPFRHHFKS